MLEGDVLHFDLSKVTQQPARYAVLTYSTPNLGDEIQSIAAQQFLPKIDLRIDRDHLNLTPNGAPELSKIILNGWHTHAPENWPPASFLHPLITSFHVTRQKFSKNSGGLNPVDILLQGKNLEYLRAYAPIGARDFWTRDLLLERGVESYFSGCLTLTLGTQEPLDREDYICAVDVPESALLKLREISKARLFVRTHYLDGGTNGERVYLAQRRLSLYSRAKCVITTRLHCALPCLALGTPVLLLADVDRDDRFGGLGTLLNHCTLKDFVQGKIAYDVDNPPLNSNEFATYRARLIRGVRLFISGNEESETVTVPPFPFKPEPYTDDLLDLEPRFGPQLEREARIGRSFRHIFARNRDYKNNQRPDFLRDVGRVYLGTDDNYEAGRLLRMAQEERPDGPYIRQLLSAYAENMEAPKPQRDDGAATNPVVAAVLSRQLTYLSRAKLHSLLKQLAEVKIRAVAGDFLEFGVALGGSGICIASQLDGARRYLGYDAFEMMPPPTPEDGESAALRHEDIVSGRSKGIGEDTYYGYVPDLYDRVIDNFNRLGFRVDQGTVNLVRGKFQEILPAQAEFPIAFAHVDCDWYEPVMYCLQFSRARLTKYGVIVVDDYNDWAGCKKAVDEFCAESNDVLLLETFPHAVLLKL
jgi:hypothetical protein